MTRVAIIGASSFTGGGFMHHAYACGADCLTLSRRDGYDLTEPADKIADMIMEFDAQHVVNFAALNMVAESWAHYQDYYSTNVIGVARLVDALRSRGWVGRWVQVSTPEVYGATDDKIIEGRPFAPSTPYAVSRAAIDMHLRALHATYGFDVVFTRTVNIYGPHQQPYRIIPKTVLSILRGQKIKLHGGGVSVRSFIHSDDVANAIYVVMRHGRAGEDYHAATREMVSIGSLVERICKIMVEPFSLHVEVDAERPGKDKMYLLDDSKIRSELGWCDKVPLDVGLRNTVEWFVSNAALFNDVPLEYSHR